MDIKVRLYTSLKAYSPDGNAKFGMAMPFGATVQDLVGALKIPETLLFTVLVNGIRKERHHRLSHNDDIVMFTLVDGG